MSHRKVNSIPYSSWDCGRGRQAGRISFDVAHTQILIKGKRCLRAAAALPLQFSFVENIEKLSSFVIFARHFHGFSRHEIKVRTHNLDEGSINQQGDQKWHFWAILINKLVAGSLASLDLRLIEMCSNQLLSCKKQKRSHSYYCMVVKVISKVATLDPIATATLTWKNFLPLTRSLAKGKFSLRRTVEVIYSSFLTWYQKQNWQHLRNINSPKNV